jgi:hypothetical protein
MGTIVKRSVIDFRAKNYAQRNRTVEILDSIPVSGNEDKAVDDQRTDKDQFIQRWYLSLQGEDTPMVCCVPNRYAPAKEPIIYRYDWTFGIAIIKGHWWDWQKELPDESAIAIHIVLHQNAGAPEAVPISGVMTGLLPSRDTTSWLEVIATEARKSAGQMIKSGDGFGSYPLAMAGQQLLSVASNSILSQVGKRGERNWFFYQFVDEQYMCPVVEYRINKRVLQEFGPLLRGTLFLTFYGGGPSSGKIRLSLRPQIRYGTKSDIEFIVPTEQLKDDSKRVFLDLAPTGLQQTT